MAKLIYASITFVPGTSQPQRNITCVPRLDINYIMLRHNVRFCACFKEISESFCFLKNSFSFWGLEIICTYMHVLFYSRYSYLSSLIFNVSIYLYHRRPKLCVPNGYVFSVQRSGYMAGNRGQGFQNTK